MELMVASAIAAVIVAGVVMAFIGQARMYRRLRELNEMRQNLRTALDMVVRDVRMAGYGVPSTGPSLWTDSMGVVSNCVAIKQGAGVDDPDEITIVSGFEEPLTSLASKASRGTTSIYVASGTGDRFNTTTKKLIFVGRLETARVLSITGDNLTISTHPTDTGRGLMHSHPAGSPLELVQVVTYSCNLSPTGFPHRPYLIRDNHSAAFISDLQKIVGLGIDDLQVKQNSNSVTIAVTGRTSHPDAEYTHPAKGDHYRRDVITTTVYPRNTL